MTPQATTGDIIGSWRAPETEGIELGYFFYPDGVLILRNPRHKRFAMRGAWKLEGDGHLVISDMVDPGEAHSEEERALIRAEQHRISITQLTHDSMVWQSENSPGQIAFHRAGGLPAREEKSYWRRIFSRE